MQLNNIPTFSGYQELFPLPYPPGACAAVKTKRTKNTARGKKYKKSWILEMKYKHIALHLIILAVTLCLSVQAFARSEIAGKVVKVSDGDTITVLAPGN